MAIYIIPFETDIELKRGLRACPKYLNLITEGKGIIANEFLPNQWQVNFYVVKCPENLALEAMPDVIVIEKGTLLELRTRLQNIGIDLTGAVSRVDVGRKIVEWLGHGSKLITEI